jgi:hypothetical protein
MLVLCELFLIKSDSIVERQALRMTSEWNILQNEDLMYMKLILVILRRL